MRVTPKVCFLGATYYHRPLDATSEKKFRELRAIGDVFVVGFSRQILPLHFTADAHFYLLPRLPLHALRYLEMLVIGPLIVLWTILRFGVRIVVAQSPYEGAAAGWAKRMAAWCGRDIALVVESHGDFEVSLFLERRVRFAMVYRRLMRCAARFAFHHADVLRAVSNSTSRQLASWNPGRPIIQFPAWTDIEVFLGKGVDRADAAAREILYAGVLIPRKGVDILVEAFARVAPEFPDAVLRIVGREQNPSYGGFLRDQATRLGVSGRVWFQSETPQAVLAEHMRRACVLVLPSHSEGLGRVIVEAMATSTPVIGTGVGGIPELIRDGQVGFLVPAGDIATLAERLRWVLRHPTDAQAMGHRGRELARVLFSPESYVAGYRRLFEAAQSIVEEKVSGVEAAPVQPGHRR